MKQYLLAAFLLFSFSTSQAELPQAFSATYTLHYDDLRVGLMQRKLSRYKDGTGLFESTGKLTGLFALIRDDSISETSRFEIKDGQLRSLEYQYSYKNSKKEKIEKHHFDWANKNRRSETNDGKFEAQLATGLTDKLLYQLAMMELKDPKQDLQFDLIDGTKLKTYRFKFEGEEKLDTTLGEFRTLKYRRTDFTDQTKKQGDKGKQRSTIVWCAPDLHYLPIRVDNVDKRGHLTSILIKKVNGF